MIITISGMPGSGKSTVARILAKKLKYTHYSIGDLRGKIAIKHDLTIDELNKIGETEAWTDREPDEYMAMLGKTEDNFIIDGWVGFHFIPHSFKVFIDIDPRIAAKRVFKNQRPDEKPVETIEEMQEMLVNRAKQSNERYKKYYNISYQNRANYDLVIDSSRLSPEEIINQILAKLPKK